MRCGGPALLRSLNAGMVGTSHAAPVYAGGHAHCPLSSSQLPWRVQPAGHVRLARALLVLVLLVRLSAARRRTVRCGGPALLRSLNVCRHITMTAPQQNPNRFFAPMAMSGRAR